MSANSKKHNKTNRKRKRRHQNKTTKTKHMKIDEVGLENDSLGRHIIQFSESLKDRFSINEQGSQDFDESLIMNSKPFTKSPDNVKSKDQAVINAIEQMSNMICEKLDQNNKLLQQLLSKPNQPQPA